MSGVRNTCLSIFVLASLAARVPAGSITYGFETTGTDFAIAALIIAAPPASATTGWTADSGSVLDFIIPAFADFHGAEADGGIISLDGSKLDGGEVTSNPIPGIGSIYAICSPIPGQSELTGDPPTGVGTLYGDWVLARAESLPEPPSMGLMAAGLIGMLIAWSLNLCRFLRVDKQETREEKTDQ